MTVLIRATNDYVLAQVKSYLQTSMSNDRLFYLFMVAAAEKKGLNFEELVDRFAGLSLSFVAVIVHIFYT